MKAPRTPATPLQFLGRSLNRTLWSGAAVAGIFFVGFGGWAAWAPLSGAAAAPAVISPEGQRRTVQHLEGGIVSELLVRDGAAVEKGQPLLVIDSAATRANYDVLHKRLRTLLAKHGRLAAERSRADDYIFSSDQFDNDSSAEMQVLFEDQRALFISRRESRHSRRKILNQRRIQLEEEIKGLEETTASQRRQLALIADEAKGVSSLLKSGYERRPRLLELQRKDAEMSGMLAANRAAIAKARSAIHETAAQIEAIDKEHMEEVWTGLTEVTAELAELREKVTAAKDVLARTVVIAPISGTVVELKVHTVGGVIAAGEKVMDIVPRDEKLLIDARISPKDIDDVAPDLPAAVILTGYKQRNIPRLEGKVRDVSADRIMNERTGEAHYLARIDLPADQLRKLAPGTVLKPGMPVEVLVLTGERSLLDYLIEPLRASFRKSLLES